MSNAQRIAPETYEYHGYTITKGDRPRLWWAQKDGDRARFDFPTVKAAVEAINTARAVS